MGRNGESACAGMVGQHGQESTIKLLLQMFGLHKVAANGLRIREGRALKTVILNIVQLLTEVQIFN